SQRSQDFARLRCGDVFQHLNGAQRLQRVGGSDRALQLGQQRLDPAADFGRWISRQRLAKQRLGQIPLALQLAGGFLTIGENRAVQVGNPAGDLFFIGGGGGTHPFHQKRDRILRGGGEAPHGSLPLGGIGRTQVGPQSIKVHRAQVFGGQRRAP